MNTSWAAFQMPQICSMQPQFDCTLFSIPREDIRLAAPKDGFARQYRDALEVAENPRLFIVNRFSFEESLEPALFWESGTCFQLS